MKLGLMSYRLYLSVVKITPLVEVDRMLLLVFMVVRFQNTFFHLFAVKLFFKFIIITKRTISKLI